MLSVPLSSEVLSLPVSVDVDGVVFSLSWSVDAEESDEFSVWVDDVVSELFEFSAFSSSIIISSVFSSGSEDGILCFPEQYFLGCSPLA